MRWYFFWFCMKIRGGFTLRNFPVKSYSLVLLIEEKTNCSNSFKRSRYRNTINTKAGKMLTPVILALGRQAGRFP